MGSWGVTMRESDYGLDMLDSIMEAQFEKNDFKYFHAAQAVELLRQEILEEIERSCRGCSPEELENYIGMNFPGDFQQAAMLVAECLAEYYENGELVVYDYSGRNTGPEERHIREVVVTEEDLRLLLEQLRNALSPESEMMSEWEWEEGCKEKWIAYAEGLCRALEQQIGKKPVPVRGTATDKGI